MSDTKHPDAVGRLPARSDGTEYPDAAQFMDITWKTVSWNAHDMARHLWAKYTERCQAFEAGMLFAARDGDGNVIPVDDRDLEVIQQHAKKLYQYMMERAAQLGVTDKIMEQCAP